MIGTRLGPYELIEEVGKGGMATVFRAYQPNVDRFVAVKVIHRSIATDAASLDSEHLWEVPHANGPQRDR